jgi:hypothetical protein
MWYVGVRKDEHKVSRFKNMEEDSPSEDLDIDRNIKTSLNRI